MITLFRRHEPELLFTASGISIKKFTRQGDAPFKKLSFFTHQVFELRDYSLRTDKEKNEFDKLFQHVPFTFELWIIPSVFNARKMVNNMEKEFEDKESIPFISFLQQRMKYVDSFRINRQFLVVNRQEGQKVIEKVKEFGISLCELPETVAKVVKVKYEVEGEQKHEEISI